MSKSAREMIVEAQREAMEHVRGYESAMVLLHEVTAERDELRAMLLRIAHHQFTGARGAIRDRRLLAEARALLARQQPSQPPGSPR